MASTDHSDNPARFAFERCVFPEASITAKLRSQLVGNDKKAFPYGGFKDTWVNVESEEFPKFKEFENETTDTYSTNSINSKPEREPTDFHFIGAKRPGVRSHKNLVVTEPQQNQLKSENNTPAEPGTESEDHPKQHIILPPFKSRNKDDASPASPSQNGGQSSDGNDSKKIAFTSQMRRHLVKCVKIEKNIDHLWKQFNRDLYDGVHPIYVEAIEKIVSHIYSKHFRHISTLPIRKYEECVKKVTSIFRHVLSVFRDSIANVGEEDENISENISSKSIELIDKDIHSLLIPKNQYNIDRFDQYHAERDNLSVRNFDRNYTPASRRQAFLKTKRVPGKLVGLEEDAEEGNISKRTDNVTTPAKYQRLEMEQLLNSVTNRPSFFFRSR